MRVSPLMLCCFGGGQGRAAREKDTSRRTTFIVKPDGGSQGDGIYLVRETEDGRLGVSLHGKPAVVQEYISRPLLMDKLKFDIRLYVLLKSLQPLEIYIAKDGLSRFCTEPYQEPSSKNIHQLFMHLTNYSLNIHSGNFIHSDNVNTGSKRSFSSVLARLSLKGCDVKKIWSDIISLVIKTIVALVPELKVYHQANIPPARPGPSCFQILGFDILLMKNMKPVLLEVNANPSMRIDHEQEVAPGVFEAVPSPVDEEVKVAVIRDTLRLVDPGLKRNIHSRSATAGKSGETGEEEEEEIWEAGEAEASTEHNLPPICLKQVFPKYAKQFSHLLVVEQVAALFIRFLGIKGTMKLGPTGFRTFIRNCKLCNSNLTMASADILYIDITRRWNLVGGDRGETGMCLQAFMDAFLYLAERKYRSLPLCAQVQALVDFCQAQLEATDEKRLGSVCGITEPVTSHPEGARSDPAIRSPINRGTTKTAPASPLPPARNRQFVNGLSSQGIL
eukprot:gi/632969419/ref/XP_007901077.1/ PREDICTED: tubulin polyglutamylase TTLL11 [Callorhinchus milii]